MARFLTMVSLFVFSASAFAHLGTFIPAIPVTMQKVWPLHLATMAVAIAMVLSVLVVLARIQRQTGCKPREAQAAIWRSLSPGTRIVGGLMVAYVVINFALFLGILQGGSPTQMDGQFVLHNHGKVVRVLTEEEYQRFQAHEVRGFSGHWMLFSLFATLWFWEVSAGSTPKP